MDKYVNDMRATRMGVGSKEPQGDEVSVSPQSHSTEVVSTNEGENVPAPSFQDAGDFLRGGGKCDGEMQVIGSENAIPKGSASVIKPSVEKGTPGPNGPGVI